MTLYIRAAIAPVDLFNIYHYNCKYTNCEGNFIALFIMLIPSGMYQLHAHITFNIYAVKLDVVWTLGINSKENCMKSSKTYINYA